MDIRCVICGDIIPEGRQVCPNCETKVSGNYPAYHISRPAGSAGRKRDAIMNINWIVRLKNKNFWIAFIPAVLLLAQVVASVFGCTIDLGDIGNKLLAVVNAVFAVLSILGIVNDPTTQGMLLDSTQAMTYNEPKKRD